MRNLKRVLSLALACVMVIGMMVMTTGAADLGDYDEITNTEAVDVMVALGVLEGDDLGNFNPTGILTREQAAKIICYMLMGKNNAEKLTGTSNFTDVAADRWSAPFISYCDTLGIISGYDGKFDPTGELTGVAFAKMLLVALGYDATIEGYVNNGNWATNIGSDAIDAGIDAGINMAAPLTREQAAQMAFETLTANLVKYESKGTNITMSDGTKVVVGATAAEPFANDAVITDKTGIANAQFCEKYFATLIPGIGADDLGRPAVTWTYAGKPVGTYADTASYTIVVSKDNTTLADILDSKKLKVNEHDTTNHYVEVTAAANGTVTTYDDSTNATTTAAGLSTAVGNLAKGTTVELFTNIEGKVTGVAVYTYDLVKITNMAKAADDADYKYLVSIADLDGSNAASYKDTKIVGFDADEFAKNDVVVVVKKTTTDLLSIAHADYVTGTMSAKGNGYIKVDGAEKKTAYSFTHADFDNEYDFYLDPNGYVMDAVAVSTVRAAVDYLYLSDVEIYTAKDDTIANSKDPYGIAKVIFTDGTEAVIDLQVKKAAADIAAANVVTFDTDEWDGAGAQIDKGDWYFTLPNGKYVEITGASGTEVANTQTGANSFADGFYGYEVKDGQYVLTNLATLSDDADLKIALTATNTADETVTVDTGDALVTGDLSGTATSKTVLTVSNDKGSSVMTGIANFPKATTFTVGTGAGKVTAILVETSDSTSTITNIYVVGGKVDTVATNWAYLTKAGDQISATETYYNFYEGGEAASYISSVTATGLHDITLTNGKVTGSSTTNVDYGTVIAVDESYFTVSTTTTPALFYFGKDCAIYNISGDFTGEETTLAKGDVVAIGHGTGANADKAEVIYVIDAPAVKGVKVGASSADTAVEFVQVGNTITVSGVYNTKLFATFNGTDYVEIGAYASKDAQGNIAFTSNSTTGISFNGIAMTFNVASMTAS